MPHRILGIAANATPTAIKSAYKRLALIYHPDVKPTGCPRKFQEIQNACDEMLNRVPQSCEDRRAWSSGAQSDRNWSYQHRAETAAEEAERLEFERLRRQWRQDYEDEYVKTSAEAEDRKRFYFKLVLAWVGFGSMIKLAMLKATQIAREQQLREAQTQQRQGEGLLTPVRTEDALRRSPQEPRLPRQRG